MRFSSVLIILFILTTFIIFFIPQSDVDFGWHYRCGQLLFDGKSCVDNIFTYYLANYKWAYPSFLFDGLLYVTYNFAGFVGTSFVYSLIMSVFAFVFYKSSRLNKPIFILFFLVSIYFSYHVLAFGLRAQILTIVFYIFLLISLRERHRLFLIPFLFLVWVNTHAGFFLGPLFFALYIFSEVVLLLFSFVSKPQFTVVSYFKHKTLKAFILLFVTFLVSVLATLINPFSYNVYFEVARHGKTPLNMLIAEWTSPNVYIILIMVFLYLFYIFLQFFNRKFVLFGTIVISVTLYLSITANRNVPLFFFSYLLFLDDFTFLSKRIDDVICLYGKKLFINLFIVFLIFFAPFVVISTFKNSTFSAYCNASNVKYPCEAYKYLEGKSVNIYNRYEWGGFLIWQLPKAKLYIDGRMPAWIDDKTGQSPYSVWLDIYQTKPGWNEKLDDLKTDYLLISPYTFIDIELTANPDKYMYKEVYRDSVSVVYERI